MKIKSRFLLISLVALSLVSTSLFSRGRDSKESGEKSGSSSSKKKISINIEKQQIKYNKIKFLIGDVFDQKAVSAKNIIITEGGKNIYTLDNFFHVVVNKDNKIIRMIVNYVESLKQKIKGGNKKVKFLDKMSKVKKAFPTAQKATWVGESGTTDETYFLMDKSILFTTRKDSGQDGLMMVQFHSPEDLQSIIEHMKTKYKLTFVEEPKDEAKDDDAKSKDSGEKKSKKRDGKRRG